MALSIVPLQAISSQTVSVVLGDQNCQITVICRRGWGVFVSIWVDDNPIVYSSLARDRVGLVRYAYTGFSGDLYFADTEGTSDPDYTGIGERWLLVYDSAAVLK